LIHGFKSYGQKKIYFGHIFKKKIVAISQKLTKFNKVCQDNSFSKIDLQQLYYNNKIRPNKKIYTKFATTESGQTSILEKKFI
jgi:hypothetical protein